MVSSVKEKADMPTVEEKQAVKMETPPVRTERQIVKSEKQPAITEQRVVSGSSSHSDRPQPKAAAPAIAEQEPKQQSIKERSSTVKRESTRKEKSRTAAEVKKGEKK